MKIGGLQKISLIDYPGKISSIIFTQGCNLRCPFCHNPELVLAQQYREPISEEEVFAFLKEREGKIQGVVITGGEPTLQVDLISFLKKIKELGFAVKLDTNGTRPDMLKAVLGQNLVDFIAMDIKAPMNKMDEVCGVKVDVDSMKESIKLICEAFCLSEFRTTYVTSYLNECDLMQMRDLVAGAKKYVIKAFVGNNNLLDSTLLDRQLGELSAEEIARLNQLYGISA